MKNKVSFFKFKCFPSFPPVFDASEMLEFNPVLKNVFLRIGVKTCICHTKGGGVKESDI